MRSLDVAKAEETMSRGARREFCRADADIQALVAVAVSDPETTKITAKQIKSLATADLPPSINDITVEKVRELINHDEYTIDTTSLTNEEKDKCLLEQNTRIEALTAHAAFNDQACAIAMKEYGYLNQEGFWQDHKPLRIIKNLLPELTDDERKQLIDLLISPIN